MNILWSMGLGLLQVVREFLEGVANILSGATERKCRLQKTWLGHPWKWRALVALTLVHCKMQCLRVGLEPSCS